MSGMAVCHLYGRFSAWHTCGMKATTVRRSAAQRTVTLRSAIRRATAQRAARHAARHAAERAAGGRLLSTPLRSKGVLTIPQAIRELLHLEVGDNLLIKVEEGRIVLTPASLVPRDQEWFHTPEWQAKEAEADEDLALGRLMRHDNDADFLASLDKD